MDRYPRAGGRAGANAIAVASVIELVSNAVLALAVIWYLWRVATFGRSRGWPLMADLLPAFPAGLWLMAASMLVRITRFARAFSLISPPARSSSSIGDGRLHRSGFHAWRRN
jgi:uncharacterized membrane protein